MGSTIVQMVMNSSTSAKIAGMLALGNQVTSNSSACSTGNEAIIDSMYRIRNGLAKRMIAGGSEGSSPYIWAGFDSMRVMCRKFNGEPEKASRPMSATAAGFVPGSGAGALILEDLETAKKRGAKIYAELFGGAVNCGGHRNGGSMTAPNPESVQRCIRAAVADAGISVKDVDAINGHLTATFADPYEVKNWAVALERTPANFPWINATKSLVGHCLGGAGAVESVGVVLQIVQGVHPPLGQQRGRAPRDRGLRPAHPAADDRGPEREDHRQGRLRFRRCEQLYDFQEVGRIRTGPRFEVLGFRQEKK